MRNMVGELLGNLIYYIGKVRQRVNGVKTGQKGFQPNLLNVELRPKGNEGVRTNYVFCPLCGQEYVALYEDGKLSLLLIGSHEQIVDEVTCEGMRREYQAAWYCRC